MKIFINNFHKDNVLEKFIDSRFEVYSRSGLNETEIRLINQLAKQTDPQNILILENRTGVLAMIAAKLFPFAKITVQNIDRYYCDKIEHNLKHNEFMNIQVKCAPDINDNYDLILYQQTMANLIKEFVLDLIQQSHKALKIKSKLFLSLEKKEKFITENMQLLFGGATIDNLNEKGLTLIGKKKYTDVHYFDFVSEFEFTDAGNILKFQSVPGVFAHHRIDAGAKALIDTIEIDQEDTLLDMGCGIGSIGIALARRKIFDQIYFVDSNSRAIKMTEINCRVNAIQNYQTELTAIGFNSPSPCQLFTGNPPYFSDYRIAGIFVDTAYNNLLKDCKAWFVARNPIKLRKIINKKFNNCHEVRHHGYSILSAIR